MRAAGAVEATRRIVHRTGEVSEYHLALAPSMPIAAPWLAPAGPALQLPPPAPTTPAEAAQFALEAKRARYYDLFNKVLSDEELTPLPDYY